MGMMLVSCDDRIVFSRYESTPVRGWERNDTLSFNIDPMQETNMYAEEVGLRINGAYPFRGLTLIVEQQTWPSGFMRSDTLSCNLIDEDGTILGEGISFYQYNFPMNNISLSKGDSLHVSIRHNMKREILPGISDIGLTLRKAD